MASTNFVRLLIPLYQQGTHLRECIQSTKRSALLLFLLLLRLLLLLPYPSVWLAQNEGDGAVGVETGYGLKGPGFDSWQRQDMFCSPNRPDRLWGPPRLLFNGYRGSVPAVKRPERDADHSPSGVEVMNACNYNYVLPIWLHGPDSDTCTSLSLLTESLRKNLEARLQTTTKVQLSLFTRSSSLLTACFVFILELGH
jgi:hypothetical protein